MGGGCGMSGGIHFAIWIGGVVIIVASLASGGIAAGNSGRGGGWRRGGWRVEGDEGVEAGYGGAEFVEGGWHGGISHWIVPCG